MKKIANLAILLFCLLLVSCHLRNGKKAKNEDAANINVETVGITFPKSEVLNLKSYYLSVGYQEDSLCLVYGYNYKTHSLDCINLNSRGISQIVFEEEGDNAVIKPITGVFVQARDSIWVCDNSQRALLVTGKVLKNINLRRKMTENDVVLVNTNYAMSTAGLYYDSHRRSLLYGVKNLSTNPVSFRIHEVFLNDSVSEADYPLSPSLVIPDAGNGDYANMSDVNIYFEKDRIIYNYPVESNIYILDKSTLRTKVVEADSRFTLNKAKKCLSRKDYAQWERHGIENPHFYNVMHLPDLDMYVRVHVGETDFDSTKDLSELIDGRDLYLMFFDANFSPMGEVKLPKHRYSFYTGWCAVNNGILLYVNNSLGEDNTEECLEVDIAEISPTKLVISGDAK